MGEVAQAAGIGRLAERFYCSMQTKFMAELSLQPVKPKLINCWSVALADPNRKLEPEVVSVQLLQVCSTTQPEFNPVRKPFGTLAKPFVAVPKGKIPLELVVKTSVVPSD